MTDDPELSATQEKQESQVKNDSEIAGGRERESEQGPFFVVPRHISRGKR